MSKLLLIFLVASGVSWGKSAPSFRGDLLTGGKVALETSLKKDRMLLVSFWATWCIPCLQELTSVTEKLKKDPSVPVDLLTVNVDREDRSEIPVTMRQLGFTFPVVLDPTGDIFGKYQKATTLPYSVLINPSQEIELEFNGYHDTMFEKVAEAAAKLKKAPAKDLASTPKPEASKGVATAPAAAKSEKAGL